MSDIQTTSVPNAGRVYDFLLGGHHNFEADRRAAGYMTSLVPSTPKWLRALRKYLHHSVLELAREGIDRFLDLGSGLPTEEHIHATVPQAQVVYTDNDPVVVAFGTELLGNAPNACYLRADIRQINSILQTPIVQEMRRGALQVGIGFNAVTCFLSDEEIRDIVRALYEWAPSGSKMFATFETKAEHLMTPQMKQLLDMFEQMGSPYHFLTLERSQELVKPWVADSRGFRPLAQIVDIGGPITEADREGVELEFYGAILVK